MSAREDVLGRIRAAAGDRRAEPAEINRGYRQHGDHPPGDPHLVELLVDRLRDYKAHVHHSAEADVATVVAGVLGPESGRERTAGDGRPTVVVPAGLPEHWIPSTVIAVPDDDLTVDSLDTMDGVITAAAVAVAQTGTIVLDASADQGRRAITLVPDLHICVIRHDQIVETVPEALAGLTPTRPLTLISGPSATSDIELDRVEGVHGPRTLHVIICQP